MEEEAHPLISIIILSLNEGDTLKYILERIEKIADQIPKYEIILVDGGSVDRTIDVGKEHGAKFTHIQVSSSRMLLLPRWLS